MNSPCPSCYGVGGKSSLGTYVGWETCVMCGGSGKNAIQYAPIPEYKFHWFDNTADLEQRVAELERELARLRLELHSV